MLASGTAFIYLMLSPKLEELDCLNGITTLLVRMIDFLRRGPLEPDRALRLRTWNAQTLLEIADCDCKVVPTRWQLDQFPSHLCSRLCNP